MALQTDWMGNYILIQTEDSLTSTELFQLNNQLLGSDDIQKIDYVLFDASKVKNIYINENDARRLAASDSIASTYITNKPVKLAFITDNQELRLLFDSYIETCKQLNITWEMNIFDRLETAYEWSTA